MPNGRLLRGALLVLGAAACYRHVPVDPAPTPLAPGTIVRVYLTPDGSTRLASRLGDGTIALDGRVDSVGAAGGGLSLAISRTTKNFGGTVTWIGEHVTIPASAIARTERRVVDRKRTTVVAAGAAIAAGAALAALISQGGAGSGDTGPPGTVTP